MLKIYVRQGKGHPWIPLYKFLVIQNEEGQYYGMTSKGPYKKVALKDFNNYKAKFPYRPYYKGSHSVSPIKQQGHLDFAVPVDWEFCVNKITSVKIKTPNFGSYISVIAGRYEPWFVHTYKWVKNGTWKAMTPLGKIAPKSVSGVSPHLDICSKKNGALYRIRSDILAHEKEDSKKA